MLILYGADLSSPSNKVRYALHALDLEYDYQRVSIKKGENRTPDYLKMHPAGKVPVLHDDGFVLFESNTILRYLAGKEESALYPAEPKARALVEQWMDFITIHVGGAMDRVAFNRVFAPLLKMEIDEKSLQAGLKFLHRFLPVVENQLGEQLFFLGAGMTLADLDLLATLDICELAKIDLTAYPRLSSWRDRMRNKELFTRCHAVYGERLQQILGGKKEQ